MSAFCYCLTPKLNQCSFEIIEKTINRTRPSDDWEELSSVIYTITVLCLFGAVIFGSMLRVVMLDKDNEIELNNVMRQMRHRESEAQKTLDKKRLLVAKEKVVRWLGGSRRKRKRKKSKCMSRRTSYDKSGRHTPRRATIATECVPEIVVTTSSSPIDRTPSKCGSFNQVIVMIEPETSETESDISSITSRKSNRSRSASVNLDFSFSDTTSAGSDTTSSDGNMSYQSEMLTVPRWNDSIRRRRSGYQLNPLNIDRNRNMRSMPAGFGSDSGSD